MSKNKEPNPWNRVEQPTKEKRTDSPITEETVKHPAFGQIGASRCSGHVNLYGSDFTHQNFIAIRIAHSELDRGLSKDWVHAKNEITEVWLSEAQWATFVSSLNSGSGVQCTIRHINYEPMPLLPPPTPRTDQFKKEAAETTQEATKALSELRDLINSSSLSKKAKEEFNWKVELAARSIGSSVDFVLKSFGEHVENTVEKAKIEVEAYINDRVQKAGLQALRNEEVPIMLTGNIDQHEL
jgi:hypothetical protein